MPLYSFVCVKCNSKFETKAQNAKYCQSRDCQKYRKDLTRKPKPVITSASQKHSVVKAAPQKQELIKASKPNKKVDVAKPKETKPKEIKPKETKKQEVVTPPKEKKFDDQNREMNVIKPNQFVEVERVNDHIIIIRTKGPKYQYVPDAVLKQNNGTIKKAPEELEPDFEKPEDLEDPEED